jgi:hypothetical protein
MVLGGMSSSKTFDRRRVTGAGDLARRVVHASGRLAFWALVTFHVGLFAVHVIQGRLFEPETAGRWIVAVLLLAGFRRLSHLGLPLVFGQRAVVLWLLVILLHCHAGWANGSASLDLAVPETLGALSQLTGSLTVLGALLVVLLVALQRLRRDGRAALAAPVILAGLASPGFVFGFAPRPPPLA